MADVQHQLAKVRDVQSLMDAPHERPTQHGVAVDPQEVRRAGVPIGVRNDGIALRFQQLVQCLLLTYCIEGFSGQFQRRQALRSPFLKQPAVAYD